MPFGLSRFDVGTQTRRLSLDEIPAKPPIVLIVRHAGETNRAWDNFQFKRRAAPATERPAEGTPEWRTFTRVENATVLAETVIAGWEGVLEDGKPVDCTPDTARRFLLELAEHCPDAWFRLLVYVHAVSNFRAPVADPVDLGKG